MTNAASVVGKKCGREDSPITAGGHGVRLPYCWIFQEASPALRMFLGCGRPVAPLLKSYANVETLSISELNDFVITAPSQDIGLFVPEKLLESSWTRDGATFPVQTVPGSFNGLSHRSHVC